MKKGSTYPSAIQAISWNTIADTIEANNYYIDVYTCRNCPKKFIAKAGNFVKLLILNFIICW